MELAVIAEQVQGASALLHPNGTLPSGAVRAVGDMRHRAIRSRQTLEIRLARSGVHSTDPRLIYQAASEMVELVRRVARVVRCRDYLRSGSPPAAVRDLEAIASRGVQLVAEHARELARSGRARRSPDGVKSLMVPAEELYHRGIAGVFNEALDPLEIFRLHALYDVLLAVVVCCEKALKALRDASVE